MYIKGHQNKGRCTLGIPQSFILLQFCIVHCLPLDSNLNAHTSDCSILVLFYLDCIPITYQEINVPLTFYVFSPQGHFYVFHRSNYFKHQLCSDCSPLSLSSCQFLHFSLVLFSMISLKVQWELTKLLFMLIHDFFGSAPILVHWFRPWLWATSTPTNFLVQKSSLAIVANSWKPFSVKRLSTLSCWQIIVCQDVCRSTLTHDPVFTVWNSLACPYGVFMYYTLCPLLQFIMLSTAVCSSLGVTS